MPAQVAPRQVDDLPWADSALTHSVPAPDTDLPGLLDDLPGRARATFYAEPEIQTGGWAREVVDFLGVDGRWRLLNLGDLGLPDSGWSGSDTFGPGDLSPDGRWWAAQSRNGVVVLDLGSGRLLTRGVPGRAGLGGAGTYFWNPASNLVYVQGRNLAPGFWVTIPELSVRRAAFCGRPLWFPDGRYALNSHAGDQMRLEVRGAVRGLDDSVSSGITVDVASRGLVSAFTDDGTLAGVQVAAGRDWVPQELAIADAVTWQVRARLVVQAGSVVHAIGPAIDGKRWLLYADGYALIWLPEELRILRLLDLREEVYPRVLEFSLATDLVFGG